MLYEVITYLLNKFSNKYKIPLVHGAIEDLRGQVTTIIPDETPCIECIFKLKDDENKSCPVLGLTPVITSYSIHYTKLYEISKFVYTVFT